MNELYADIIVDISVQALDRPFSYRIPDALRDTVSVGSLVTIPFGPRMVRGYVIRLKDSSDYDPDKIKDIAAVLTDEETVEARLIAGCAGPTAESWLSHFALYCLSGKR